ncbi:MAG: FAD-binding protein [Tannerella sp.]|jgi:uncharacterized FAD-dependent dehydrogenase|nr:FAD-binding protein [Tannerella sp.]
MIKELQLRILPKEAFNEQSLRRVVCRETGENPEAINAVRVLKRSVDARQRTVYVNVSLRVFINEEPAGNIYKTIEYKDVSGGKQVVVVGGGPGGLFAALRLIELGLRPVVIERGKNVHERKKDIALISREHRVNPESNYCFGEGGAGAYSDGKLYTRSKKRGSVERILHIFCQHGAAPAILSDVHPHIGTDKLPRVIENIRNRILCSGGEVHFETCMESLIIKGDEALGVNTRDGRLFMGPVILATGHSARDVYRYLAMQNIAVEAKGIAVGVRLEHPQALIDRIRYHDENGRGEYLPAAEYSFVTQSADRGVYSFCMCPGGFVVPAATGPEEVVVNGMSPSNRSSQWANSGMVVEIRPEDLRNRRLRITGADLGETKEALCTDSASGVANLPLSGSESLHVMHFQEQLERLCRINGGMRQTAPAQRMADFVRKCNSSELPVSSYIPGLQASPLHFWMPEFITSRLREGFRHFDKISCGFLTNEAVMIGVETRTSSPVRILRDRETMRHITLKGLYPCGEGAGYAGGIVSAAIDGERCAECVAASF